MGQGKPMKMIIMYIFPTVLCQFQNYATLVIYQKLATLDELVLLTTR